MADCEGTRTLYVGRERGRSIVALVCILFAFNGMGSVWMALLQSIGIVNVAADLVDGQIGSC